MFGRAIIALICALTTVVPSLGAQQPAPLALSRPATDASSTKFLLEDGTPIRLRLKRQISSAAAKTGDNVDFEVSEEVKVGEVVVIPRGNPAVGTVTAAQSARRMGRGGKLNIEIDYVRLADGEKATLRAAEGTNGEGHVGTMVGDMVVSTVILGPVAAPIFLLTEGEDSMFERDTEITAHVNGTMQLDLAKFRTTPTPPVNTRLQIISHPPGAEISVDGNFVGSTPSEIEIAQGLHTITISKAGCRTWERTLVVPAGKVTTLAATLYPTAIKLR
ncbi:MAG: PEGA domain-containing protein [Candidatus Korobacteraceae bacterium]